MIFEYLYHSISQLWKTLESPGEFLKIADAQVAHQWFQESTTKVFADVT